MFRDLVILVLLAAAVPARARSQDFNAYVLKSISTLYPKYSKGGYDIGSVLTHDIAYGDRGMVRATSPRKTMCVAAVMEIMIEAINAYAAETGDKSPYAKIPLAAWTTGNAVSLKANIFMYGGTGSRGTGHTLSQFGLGEELAFKDLLPGDFVNLNRTNKTGHPVVFLGYLGRDQKTRTALGPDVAGFRYFSAQGKGKPDAGLAYRNAFFDGFCPTTADTPRDCGIIRSANPALLDAGRMWEPSRWTYVQAVADRKRSARSLVEAANQGASRGTVDALVDAELRADLQWTPSQRQALDGETTD